jgi:amino acid carrier protein
METLTQFVQSINSFLWGPFCLIPLLCGTGLYFSFRLRFVQIRKFGLCCKQVLGGFSLSGEKADKTGMSSFQALATAVAAQVGTGNMVGVATALAMGGPGAIFWMWVAAFCGMATIFAEAVLALIYKETDKHGHTVGGPAYYITKGLGSKPLAVFFSVALIVALGFVGNMVQANSIADAFSKAFPVSPLAVGVVVAALSATVFFGGIGRLAAVTEKIVPVMAAFYLIGGTYILAMHSSAFLACLKDIFSCAFGLEAAVGGAVGASIKEAMRYGIARGLFSNEAGMGSTPHAHAVSKVAHPAQQGFAAIIGVFITVLICSMSAFVVLSTGVLDGQTTGVALTQKAFTTGLGGAGNAYVAIILLFFSFSTIIGWYFFGEQNIRFLFGRKGLLPYRVLVLLFLVLGSSLKVTLVWELADLFNGLMVLPNLIALVALAKVVSMALDEFDALPAARADSGKSGKTAPVPGPAD